MDAEAREIIRRVEQGTDDPELIRQYRAVMLRGRCAVGGHEDLIQGPDGILRYSCCGRTSDIQLPPPKVTP